MGVFSELSYAITIFGEIHPFAHGGQPYISMLFPEGLYMVVDTHNWWPGKHVLVPPQWIESVHWSQSSVVVDLWRETIKAGAEYDPSTLLKSGIRDQAPPESPARVIWGETSSA
jgi:hypothetical protein